MTLSHWQQSELEFNEYKPNRGSSAEEFVAVMNKDLNWTRACFWSPGQDRQRLNKKKKIINNPNSDKFIFAIVLVSAAASFFLDISTSWDLGVSQKQLAQQEALLAEAVFP